MYKENKFSVCYMLDGLEHLIQASDENIVIEQVISKENEYRQDIMLSLRNTSDRQVFLKYVTLWQAAEEEELCIGDGPFEVYRSGRHKNDMPGTFTLGMPDERMKDVLGAMSETGDKTEAGSTLRKLISDHLTIFTGSERSLLIEFTGGRKQLFETEIILDNEYAFSSVSAKAVFNVFLEPYQWVECEDLRLVWTDAVETEIERFAREKRDKYGSRKGGKQAVFCTWYYYGLTVTYEDVKTNLQIMKEKNLPFDVFQIDEGWEITLGEWEANSKFPVPMKQVAEEIREAGYRPGIWTSPFIAHESASIWQVHPEWRLNDKDGNPCLFPMNDTVYYVLDITNPATYGYFTDLYQKLTFRWGYTYHKLDFTRAAVNYEDADFFDKTITLAEAYYKAVCAIRKGMGEEAYFLMCGGLYDPIIGLVDAQRTGSDVLSMWSSTINKNGKTAPYTIKQSMFRHYMNYWWDNDPDALMIRENPVMERNLRLTYGLLNDEEVKTVVLNQFMAGGIMCATEPLDKIADNRLMEYRRILPVLPVFSRPVDLMEKVRFPRMVDVFSKSLKAHFLCVVNWNDEQELTAEICVEKLLPKFAQKDDKYVICDYYAKEYYTNVAGKQTLLMKPILPHGANVYKVTKMSREPMVVRSEGHYSMGGEFDRLEYIGGRLYYRVKNYFDKIMTYDILLPDGQVIMLQAQKGVTEGSYTETC